VSATFEIFNGLGSSGVKVISIQESWTEVDGPLRELPLSIVAWFARIESEPRSERTRVGLTRTVAEG
jgi:DNA invertase Pin-like site-specific DNA recombinase